MGNDSEIVSGWFVLNSGFKVYGRCSHCSSPNIAYHKDRMTGLKGISSNSKGISPACLDCGHGLPPQGKRKAKAPLRKPRSKRVSS